jgi:hypothetical protein
MYSSTHGYHTTQHTPPSLDLAKWIRLGAAAVFFEAEFDEEHKPFLVKRIWDLAGLPIAERLTQSAKNVLKKITWLERSWCNREYV